MFSGCTCWCLSVLKLKQDRVTETYSISLGHIIFPSSSSPIAELTTCGLNCTSTFLKEKMFNVIYWCICRGWTGYVFSTLFIFLAIFMLLNRWSGVGRPIDELKVIAPPAMNTMEQLLAVQNAVSLAEELIQDGNIVFLKCRALLLSIFPQVLFLLHMQSFSFSAFLLVGWQISSTVRNNF